MLKKGFTLIELLVVIAIMAVIAAAVLVAIDPVDKIRSANDAKVQADVGQIATALTTYAATNGGVYPTSAEGLAKLETSGELSKLPKPPTAAGYGAAYSYASDATGSFANISGTILSKKYSGAAKTAWGWCNTSTSAGAVDALGTCPP